MAVYVDELADWGWIMHGKSVLSCHMITDAVDLEELHEMADRIGLKRSWFQDGNDPHYDLTKARRYKAIELGATRIGRRETVEILRARRAALPERSK